jgi:hypothetical protein
MKVNDQSRFEKYIMTDDDTVIGRATLLANGRWAAYDVMGIRRLHDTGITFETAEDVAEFFALTVKGLKDKSDD